METWKTSKNRSATAIIAERTAASSRFAAVIWLEFFLRRGHAIFIPVKIIRSTVNNLTKPSNFNKGIGEVTGSVAQPVRAQDS